MRYIRTQLKLYLTALIRRRLGRLILITVALPLFWIILIILCDVLVSERDPLEVVVLKSQDDTEAMFSRKRDIYKALREVRNFLETNPPRWRLFSNPQSYPTWLPALLAKPLRVLYSCRSFNEEGFLTLPVFSVHATNTTKGKSKSPTMATQLSADRFGTLGKLVDSWQAPISVAVYVEHRNLHFLKEFLRPAFYKRDNLLMHFVPAKGDFFPVNQLRNIALRAAQTDYVFVNDVDFMPSPDMDTELQKVIVSNFFRSHSRPKALVVPAFQLHISDDKPPSTKEELKSKFNVSVSMFGANQFQQGHNVTDYKRWFSAGDIYQVRWHEGWEPYVLVKKSECPLFNQRFLGRIRDKVSFIATLHYLDFRFFVHPTSFITHLYHVPYAAMYKTLYLRCSRALLRNYIRFLNRERNRRRRLGLKKG